MRSRSDSDRVPPRVTERTRSRSASAILSAAAGGGEGFRRLFEGGFAHGNDRLGLGAGTGV